MASIPTGQEEEEVVSFSKNDAKTLLILAVIEVFEITGHVD